MLILYFFHENGLLNSIMVLYIICFSVVTCEFNMVSYEVENSFYNLSQLSISFNASRKVSNDNWPVLGLSIFSVFGVFGNLLVCLTIKRDHTLQTSVNFYLFSLAIADLAVCSIVIPLSLIQDFKGKYKILHKIQ